MNDKLKKALEDYKEKVKNKKAQNNGAPEPNADSGYAGVTAAEPNVEQSMAANENGEKASLKEPLPGEESASLSEDQNQASAPVFKKKLFGGFKIAEKAPQETPQSEAEKGETAATEADSLSDTVKLPKLSRRFYRKNFAGLNTPLYKSANSYREGDAFRRELIKKANEEANAPTGNKKAKMKFSFEGETKREKRLREREEKRAQKENHSPKKIIPKRRFFLKAFIALFAFCFICGLAVLGVFLTWMAQAPEIDLSKFEFTTATVIYDNSGNVYQTLQGEEMRLPVTIDEIPEMVQLAFVAIEDQRFYSHFGVDIRGTLKAVVSVLKSGSTDGPGGSTITQQLIKQTHLTSAVSVKRKVMEWYLSVKLENMLEKRDILEAYLNKVNMSDAWGIGAAAKYYFGVSPKNLTVAQAAVLAAIINSPAYYNPYDYRENEDGNVYLYRYTNEEGRSVIGYSQENYSRASDVVDKMYELGYISEREYKIAENDLENNLIGLVTPDSVDTYTYFTDAVYAQVVNELVSTYNYSTEDATDLLLNGGLHIYSTVDTVIQSALEREASDGDNFPDQTYLAAEASYALSASTGEAVSLLPQVGGAVIENATGYVSGIIGGRSKNVSLSLNRALEPYQVGSTTKPLTVYSAGIDSGAITLATTFDDSRYSFGGGWRPVNHGYASSESMMTVREALRTSVNVVAVLAQMRVGDATSIAYGQKYGLNIVTEGEVNDMNASALALGGYVIGQTPLAMASAYTTFPNGGYRYTPTFYTHVTDSNGVTILTANQERIDVISPQTAWIVTDVLKQVVRGGTTYVSVSGQEVGGKTGTTDSNRAVWFCGFTPRYTGVFRYGYDFNAVTVDGYTYDLYISTTSGGSYYSPAQFWRRVFNYFYEVKGLPDASLPYRPDGINVGTVDAESGMLPGELTQKTVSDYFLPGTMPGETDNMHKEFEVCAVSGKWPNQYCATMKKVFFVKDDSVLLPSGARRLTGESQEPKEDDPCTVCTPESMGLNIYGVSFPLAEVTVKEGETTFLRLTDSLGNTIKLGKINSSVSNATGVESWVVADCVYIKGLTEGVYSVTGSLTLNGGTNKEITYVANVNVVVEKEPVAPPEPPTPPVTP